MIVIREIIDLYMKEIVKDFIAFLVFVAIIGGLCYMAVNAWDVSIIGG